MKKNKILLIITILFLSIGFAAVSTTLILNGNILIGTNESDFDVIFTKSIIDSVDVSDATISEDGKSITFNTRELSTLSDKSVLDFEVTNKSTQYDANVTIECVGGKKENEYYTITKDFPTLVIAQTKETGKVDVELKKVTTEAISETFTCTLNVNAIERSEIAKSQRPDLITAGKMNTEWEMYSQNHTTGSIKYNEDNIYMHTGKAFVYSSFKTVDKIDLTDHDTLSVRGMINSRNTGSGHIFISTNPKVSAVTTNYNGVTEGLVKTRILESTPQVHTIDISDLTGEYYVGVFGSNRYITIYDVWLS